MDLMIVYTNAIQVQRIQLVYQVFWGICCTIYHCMG